MNDGWSRVRFKFPGSATIPNLIRACGQRSRPSRRGVGQRSGSATESETVALVPAPPAPQPRRREPPTQECSAGRPHARTASTPAPSAVSPAARRPGPQTRARALRPATRSGRGGGPGRSYLVQLLGGHGGRRGARRGAGPARRRAAGGPHFVPVGSLRGLRFLLRRRRSAGRAGAHSRRCGPPAGSVRRSNCATRPPRRAHSAAGRLRPGSSRRRGAGPGWGGRGGGARRRARAPQLPSPR